MTQLDTIKKNLREEFHKTIGRICLSPNCEYCKKEDDFLDHAIDQVVRECFEACIPPKKPDAKTFGELLGGGTLKAWKGCHDQILTNFKRFKNGV